MPKQKFVMPTGELAERDMPQWKTPFNHDTNFESDRTATYCADPSLTKQEFVEEQDINTILERLAKTGEIPAIVLPEHFMDLSGRTDYFTMASKIADTNRLFYMLPAATRSEFLNDPARWADAVVQATEAGDADMLEALGIELTEERKAAVARKPPEKAEAGTSPPGGTPASDSTKASQAAPKGDPKSESGK